MSRIFNCELPGRICVEANPQVTVLVRCGECAGRQEDEA